ncbi:phage scaffolding protein [Breznakia sp. OttesenSCG-928-G09]|nr:phage scaffolding protein [Breznakia sp. OttesenSCG-928-G09]
MDFLKEFLDEETYSKVESQLKGNDKVKLANLKTGEYVSKDKYDAAVTNLDTVKADLAKRDTDLENLKKSMPEDKTKDIEALQTKYTEDTQALEQKLKQNKVEAAVQIAIAKSGAKDDVAVKAHLDSFVKDAKFDEEKGMLVGLDDQLSTLKKDKSYLFEDGAAGGQTHNTPPTDEPKDLGSALQDYYKQ